MEKKQYELCVEVLRRLNNAKVLKDIILIGSWCIPFYREYFVKGEYIPSIKTRDIDFLVPVPKRIRTKVDIPELLKDLGFVVGFKGAEGYIRLEHPELIIEFLVAEKGKGLDKPYPLPQLGLNAQALRFLSFLTGNTIRVRIGDVPIILPHPVNFSLHKLIIFQRRKNPQKMTKDKETAIKILKALVDNSEQDAIKKVFDSVPQKWQKKIIKGLVETKEKDILEILKTK